MEYQNIIFEKKDNGVAIVTFNRPKALNALNRATLEELADVIEDIKSSEDVKVLIITGAGEKAFVAGADIKEFQKMTPLAAKRFAELGQRIFFELEELPIPVIACVNGFALGGGCELAMSCDFIYASDNARFGQPEINLGIIPGFGGTQRLSRLVGRSRALELCLTGDMIDAQAALEIGLVNQVIPQQQLMEATLDVANLLASKSRVALRGIKQVIHKGLAVDLRHGCAMEVDAFAVAFSSEDAKEGVAAFLEKRQPNFTGSLDK